jgi:hypothetical protein
MSGARSSTEESLELHTKFWLDNIKGRYNMGDVPSDMRRTLIGLKTNGIR